MKQSHIKSHLVRHSGMGRVFKDTHRGLKHLRHSESTRTLGHSESTSRTLGWHSGTRKRMALGRLESTQELGGYSSSRALKAVGYSDT